MALSSPDPAPRRTSCPRLADARPAPRRRGDGWLADNAWYSACKTRYDVNVVLGDRRAGIRMSASTQSDQDLSRREEMTVSSAAMSAAPWGAATVTGGVVALGDLGLHVVGGHIGLSALSGSVAFGAVAFFVVAAAGALWRARPSRAIRWARSNPWRFAVLPALACAAVALVLSVVTGGGIITPVLSGLWHGGITFGLVGAAGVVSKSRNREA